MTVSLSWAGKRPPESPSPATLTLRETFEPNRLINAAGDAPANALYHGDNLPILATLAAGELRGRVRLIYADPPYNSGVDWAQRLRRDGRAFARPGKGYRHGAAPSAQSKAAVINSGRAPRSAA